eukprot:gnl/MRDRNA2_/MRDRNA2_103208_c0_seq1.p1 gnl/MRDRNA2_/MRDRNA2_103208_c0~~gnl/MRDRNA2_/MRDRNA2_103208_c0_seq1.p1  ORF type:complete len:267 (+),score=63.34 gnl/MRDRNA2_/MRDRNA2_103208_c0_seq1:78-878(+)
MGDEQEVPVVFEPLNDEVFAGREQVYKQLFAGCSANDAKQLAKGERAPLPEKDINGYLTRDSLTYAEVDIKTMRVIVEKCASIGPLITGQGSFVDLGSGAGKAAMAAALIGPWAKVTGVEFLQGLHNVATKSVERLEAHPLHAEIPLPAVNFVKGDFADPRPSQSPLKSLGPECTCCFAVATMYQAPQLEAMTEIGKMMPLNSFFVTYSQKLVKAGDEWQEVHKEQMDMGWGPATLFIFKKMPPPEIEAEVSADAAAEESAEAADA